jgi:hypothetical protein
VVGVLLFDITRITSRTSLTHALPLPFERKKPREFCWKKFCFFRSFSKAVQHQNKQASSDAFSPTQHSSVVFPMRSLFLWGLMVWKPTKELLERIAFALSLYLSPLRARVRACVSVFVLAPDASHLYRSHKNRTGCFDQAEQIARAI